MTKTYEQMRLLIQQENRKCDSFGCGFFGASRGKRKHTGLDLIIEPEENVFSPIDGKITKVGYCYNDDLSFRYVEITNSKFVIRVLYVDPLVDVGDWVKSGDYLGYGQSLQKRYEGITDHIHVEIKIGGVFVDPELYLDNDEK